MVFRQFADGILPLTDHSGDRFRRNEPFGKLLAAEWGDSRIEQCENRIFPEKVEVERKMVGRVDMFGTSGE